MTALDLQDCLFHRYVAPASKKDAPRTNWPWPSMSTFKVDPDGVSFDDGRTWDANHVRAHIGTLPQVKDPSKARDADTYGLTVISRKRLAQHFKRAYKIRRKPTKAVGNMPANPAHTLVVPPIGYHETLVRSDLWTVSQGYEPPPTLKIPDSAWARWEDIAFKRAAN